MQIYSLCRRFWFACLLVAAAAFPAFATQDEDLQPDLNALRAKAEAGSVTAQTQLADYFIAADDYTNAVVWYRKAAEQGDLTAQLSVASLLLAGRGTEKNPREAAKWLRAAADRIETNSPGRNPIPAIAIAPLTNAPAKYPTNAIIITRANISSNVPPVVAPPAQASLQPSPATNPPSPTQVRRAGAAIRDPVLQDPPPVLRPPQAPR